MFNPPLMERNTKNVKDYLLLILLSDFPLRTKSIYNYLRKRYGLSVTYQGVHKAVNSLVGEGILSKSEEGYSISQNWVRNLDLFLDMVKSNYGGQEILKELSKLKRDGDIKMLTASNFFEVYTIQMIVRNRFRKQFENVPFQDKPIRITHNHHVFRFVLNPMDAHQGHLIDSYRFNHYYLIEGNSKVDQESVRLIHSYPGLKKYDRFLLGATLSRGCHLAVYDDLIFEVHLPTELKRKISHYFNTAKSISTFDTLGFFRDVSVASHKIKIILCKDRQLAETITKSTLSYFKNEV